MGFSVPVLLDNVIISYLNMKVNTIYKKNKKIFYRTSVRQDILNEKYYNIFVLPAIIKNIIIFL